MISSTTAPTEPTASLRALLHQVYYQADATFTGLGVIVWDGVSTIPIRPMRSEPPGGILHDSTINVLMNISHESSPFHDGFHVVDVTLALLQVSVYFSPMINSKVETPTTGQMFGGRYLAAAFGSCLEGVLCTGVVSRQYGPIVFKQGKPV